MKKIVSRIAVLPVVGCVAFAEAAPDGTYHGTSFGRNGDTTTYHRRFSEEAETRSFSGD